MAVTIGLLGSFTVDVDGVRVPPDAWARRSAASLVKLLALSERRRLHREQVIEALWPGQPVETAGPRLHKAAHYARRALGDRTNAMVLRQDMVTLLPEDDVVVDVAEFLEHGRHAVDEKSPDGAQQALELYGGELLPEDLYEPWTTGARDDVRHVRVDLLRLARRWKQLLELEPADEEAHLALATELAQRGESRAALRQLERLDNALRRELGTAPGPAARQLQERLQAATQVAAPATQSTRLVGRREAGDRIRARLERAGASKGGAVVLAGPPGVGKTALLDLTVSLARRRGWRTGRGLATAVEGPWPYAPVLEALGDLCRQHPALLDGLGDVYRDEIDHALAGRETVWTGESGHQRLFVAAAELVRLAAADHGLLLVVDDVQDADEASMRLIHYLVRCAATEPVLVAVAHRPDPPTPVADVLTSLVARDLDAQIDVTPLPEPALRRLLVERHPDLSSDDVARVVQASGGLPFTALELGRRASGGTTRGTGVIPAVPPAVVQTFSRVALLGMTFTLDELVAVADVEEDVAYQHLDVALSSLLVEPGENGHRFRHPLVREALIEQLAPSAAVTARREVAEALARLGAPASRVAHQFLAAGLPRRALPYVARAIEVDGALGAYRDALGLLDAVRDHAAGSPELPRLLARRGDLLLALGDPGAAEAYGEALPVTSGTEHRLVRARLARASGLTGDVDTAAAALDGLDLEGDAADGPLLIARGNLAYFTGDVDAAWDIAAQARALLPLAVDEWHLMDLISLQGLIAHQRGEWFDRFRMELRRTRGQERLAVALFDAHLCVAEYLLYGPVPYDEVIRDTEELRTRANQAGALRGVAFATALIGEAALLMGDLERAERELEESVELHRDIDAPAGEAHSLQRLAEVRLAQGDRGAAGQLLQRALPLARWAVISMHLLQRIYGTMIAAAPDPAAARAVVDRAEATMGQRDACSFCDVMLAVPAAIACADVGDLEDAQRYLSIARKSAARWEGTAWQAAVTEAEAHLARADGDESRAVGLAEQAAVLFDTAGHLTDAERCRSLAARSVEPVAYAEPTG
ncbi:ATP-binding protein [Nocardioides sp.]|uniref:ATP-binding protein n=1 Tax=Nocardioides sp. TaxID=35761 RepID=UPI002ED3C4A5